MDTVKQISAMAAPVLQPWLQTSARIVVAVDEALLPLTNVADSLAEMTGMGLVTLKFTLVLFLAYPLALPVRWLPSPALRHAWVGLGGAILAYFTFGSSWLSVLYSSLTAYALLWILNYVPILRNWRHFAAATASFGYLMHRHWQRSSDVTASDIDDVVLHLVVAVKIFTFAFCVYDGSGPGKRALDKKLETLNSKEAGGPEKNGKAIAIVEDRRGRSIATLPNPLQYLGYILNFTTMFVGPAFEYGEYIKSQERADTPPTNRFIPAVWKLVQASAYMGVYAVFAPHYTAEGVYKLASQAPHAFYNFPALLKYSLAAYLLVRMSYYAVWKLAEGAAVIAGFGYRASNKPGRAAPAWEDACWSFTNILGLPLTSIQSIASVLCCGRKDASERALALLGMPLAGVSSSKPDWEGANNVNPISVETSRNIQDVLSNWNMQVQSWLQRYIFFRAPRAYARWLTFLMSAFWHGFFPGYYMAFTTIPLMVEAVRAFDDALRPYLILSLGWTDGGRMPRTGPLWAPLYVLWSVLKQMITFGSLSYVMGPFVVFHWEKGLAIWAYWGYLGHLVPILIFIGALALKSLTPKAMVQEAAVRSLGKGLVSPASKAAAAASTSSNGRQLGTKSVVGDLAVANGNGNGR